MAQWLREFSVGDWYEANDESFEIVGIDIKTEMVLVQHYSGTLDEIAFDSWTELNARPTAAPEDLSGALDADPEDFGFIGDNAGPGESRDPVEWLDAHGF